MLKILGTENVGNDQVVGKIGIRGTLAHRKRKRRRHEHLEIVSSTAIRRDSYIILI